MSEDTKIKTDGLTLVIQERQRQIMGEGYSHDHDDQLGYGELAIAGICYATPMRLYRRNDFRNSLSFIDPFPWSGGIKDKRYDWGTTEHMGQLANPETYSEEQQLESLTKGAALIVAEIDKLLRKRGEYGKSE